MDSKKGKSELKYPQSQAPPADAKSLDFSKLVIADSSKPSSSAAKRSQKPSSSAKISDSHKPSSSAKIVHSQRSSSSALRGLDSHRPSTAKIVDSHKPSSSTARGVDSQRPQQTLPPAYPTYVNAVRDSRAGGQSKDQTRSPYPEDKKSHSASSSRQSSSHSSSSQNYVSQRAADNSRIATNKSPIGAMDRTYFEGQALKTEFANKSSREKDYPANTLAPGRSIAPLFARSILTNPEDIKMASRQTQYKSLALDEREKQDKWAQTMIKRTGSCPEGFEWERTDDAYRCKGKHHYITDELLREGMGGVMALLDANIEHDRLGPYYEDPDMPGRFKYGGPLPKPDRAPEYIGGGGAGRAASMLGGANFPGSSAHITNAVNASIAQALRSQRYPTGHPHGSHQGSVFGPHRYSGI